MKIELTFKLIGFAFASAMFALTSCCRDESVETARYQLSGNELKLIPYENGQKISFVHSNGYEFDFTVTEDKLEWQVYQEFCEWNCCGLDYYSYQVRTTKLASAYPDLAIEMSLSSDAYNLYPRIFSLNINNRHFLSIQYDSLANFICSPSNGTICFDTVSIQNEIFTDVIEKKFDMHYFIEDSTILVPESILINSLGLLQIKMSNAETFSINN
jgi:hypothetical protein